MHSHWISRNDSDDEDNTTDFLILPPGRVDSFTDDEEEDDNLDKLSPNALSRYITGSIEIHSNSIFLTK